MHCARLSLADELMREVEARAVWKRLREEHTETARKQAEDDTKKALVREVKCATKEAALQFRAGKGKEPADDNTT